jgi:hypothetical protein
MFRCELCDYSTDRSTDLKKHNNTNKHKRKAHKNIVNNIQNGLEIDNVPLEQLQDYEICQEIENWKKNSNKKIVDLSGNLTNVPKNNVQNQKNSKTCEQIDNSNKKHLTKKHVCACGKEFGTRQNLWNHKQICKEKKLVEQAQKIEEQEQKIQQIQEYNEKMEQKIKELENTLTNFTKLINLPQTQQAPLTNAQNYNNNAQSNNVNSHNTLNNTLNNTNNINELNNNQKIMVFNYVSQHFQEAEPIKMLEKQDICKMLVIPNDTKHTLEDFIIYNQRNNNLNGFLGDIIISAYKKEDPKKQQIWSSNVMKLTFIVRQILNKENVWLKDMNGVCITRHIIDPILKEIKKMLQKYVKLCEKIGNKSFEEFEKLQTNGMVAVDIIKEINDKELHKKILKYIAPHFQLEQNNLICK